MFHQGVKGGQFHRTLFPLEGKPERGFPEGPDLAEKGLQLVEFCRFDDLRLEQHGGFPARTKHPEAQGVLVLFGIPHERDFAAVIPQSGAQAGPHFPKGLR